MATIYYGGTVTTNSATTNNEWGIWVSGTDATNVWTTWNSGTITINEYGNTNPIAVQNVPPPTPEETARIQNEWQEIQDRAAEDQRKRIEADKRANELLFSLLTKAQIKEYKEQGTISIYHQDKLKWKLRKERNANIDEFDDSGKRIAKHCVQTIGTPLDDQLAAQLLYLNDNPADLLRVANTHRY